MTQLTEKSTQLIRAELRLAQAEMTAKAKHAGIGAGLFGGAGLVALYGVGALIATVILALSLVMDPWLAALIVTVVLFAVAGVAALLGKKQVSEATPPQAGADHRQRPAGRAGRQGGHPVMSSSDPQETAVQHTANGTPDIDELQSQIEQTREELAETVDALGAKLDVKSRAKDKVSSTTEQARAGVEVARDRVVHETSKAVNAATDDNGRPTPPVIVAVSAAAAAALLVTGLVVWRRRR